MDYRRVEILERELRTLSALQTREKGLEMQADWARDADRRPARGLRRGLRLTKIAIRHALGRKEIEDLNFNRGLTKSSGESRPAEQAAAGKPKFGFIGRPSAGAAVVGAEIRAFNDRARGVHREVPLDSGVSARAWEAVSTAGGDDGSAVRPSQWQQRTADEARRAQEASDRGFILTLRKNGMTVRISWDDKLQGFALTCADIQDTSESRTEPILVARTQADAHAVFDAVDDSIVWYEYGQYRELARKVTESPEDFDVLIDIAAVIRRAAAPARGPAENHRDFEPRTVNGITITCRWEIDCFRVDFETAYFDTGKGDGIDVGSDRTAAERAFDAIVAMARQFSDERFAGLLHASRDLPEVSEAQKSPDRSSGGSGICIL